jgi:hypothetical protein
MIKILKVVVCMFLSSVFGVLQWACYAELVTSPRHIPFDLFDTYSIVGYEASLCSVLSFVFLVGGLTALFRLRWHS